MAAICEETTGIMAIAILPSPTSAAALAGAAIAQSRNGRHGLSPVESIELLHQPRQLLSQAVFDGAVDGAEPGDVRRLARAVASECGEICPVMPEHPLVAPARIDADGQPRDRTCRGIAYVKAGPVRLAPRRSCSRTSVLSPRSCRCGRGPVPLRRCCQGSRQVRRRRGRSWIASAGDRLSRSRWCFLAL